MILTVTDDDGAFASASAVKSVLNRPPVAAFTESAVSVYTGDVISFNASASFDPDGSIVSYFWEFGDGSNATGIVIAHSYSADENYTVTLIVTDDDSVSDTSLSTKVVLNRSPVASFTESAVTVYTADVIVFNASASFDPDGSVVSYLWEFGDGVNTSGIVVSHAYSDDGNYTVTLTVTDDDGATGTVTSTKTILNRSPVAAFTESATTVYTNELISFNASASFDPDGTVVSFFWDFGDGTNATGITIQHSFADNGTYLVTFTVTDDDNETAAISAIKNVANKPPIASFTESLTSVVVGEIIYFNASASFDPDGYIVSYLWEFGDGSNATGVTTQHSFADNGVYNVTLTVSDDGGATDDATAEKTI